MKDTLVRLPMLVLLLTFLAVGYTIAHNKVVVIPLGSDDSILRLFTYDEETDRLTIQGTNNMPLSEVLVQSANLRGAGMVRQDTRADAPDIPSNFTLVEVEEESISFGSNVIPGTQAVVVHASASIDTSGGVDCPCEFRSFIVQDDGTPTEVTSLATYLEVEGGDNDIDATIRNSFAFIVTAPNHNFSFQVGLFQQGSAPADGFYEVGEAVITLTSHGLSSPGVL